MILFITISQSRQKKNVQKTNYVKREV